MSSNECIYNEKTNRCVMTQGGIGKRIVKNLSPHEISTLQDKCYKKVKCAVKVSEKSKKKKESVYKIPKNDQTEREKRKRTPKKPVQIRISRPPSPSIHEEVEEIKVDPDECINRSKIPLLPHQIKVIKHLQDNRGIIAIHSVGSGKTLLAVTSSQCFLNQYPTSKVIVISPAILIDNFKKGMEYYGLERNDPRYEFYSFEAFLKAISVNQICRNNFLIVDEAHVLRTDASTENSGAKARKVIQCSRTAIKVLCLTATPIVNKSYDLENLLSMVKGKLPMTEREWNSLVTKQSEFFMYIKDCFDFYQNKLIKFPSKKVHEVIIPMDDTFYQGYRDVEKKNEALMSRYKISGDPFRFLQGLRTGLLKITDSAKINWTAKHIRTWLEKGQKTVIFTNFVESGVKILEKHLHELDLNCWNGTGKPNPKKKYYSIISGSVLNKRRKDIIDQFNKDKINVLILSSAGGVGIDLKGVRHMVILDVPWNKANLDQAIGRAVRYESHEHLPENERKVDIWILYNTKPSKYKDEIESADMLLYRIIKSKEEIEQEMLEVIKKVSIR